MPKKKRPLRTGRRPATAIQKDIDLLGDWEKRNIEVEMCVHVPGSASLIYPGHVMQLTASGDWMFIGGRMGAPTLRVLLFVELWHKSQIEDKGGVYRSLHVQQWPEKTFGFCIRESLIPKKKNLDLAKAENQIRAWERLRVKLSVIVAHGYHATCFLGLAIETHPGMFSFMQIGQTLQIIIRVQDYPYVEVKTEGDTTSIVLVNASTRESLKVSDSTERPEEIFKRFAAATPLIH